MTIEQMHYQFKLQSNQQDTLKNKDWTPLEIDTFLRISINKLVNTYYTGNNVIGLGFDTAQKITDELHTLVVSSPSVQPSLQPFSNIDGVYIYDLNDLDYEYWHFLRAYINSKDCDAPINVHVEEQDDLNFKLRNFNTKPSLKWRRALLTVTSNNINVYTGKDFTADALFLTYLKKPNDVSIGGYVDVIGNTVVKTECDLPEKMHIRVVNEAVLEAKGVLENIQGYQVAQQRAASNS